jgi:hypothetical protein
MQGYKTWADWTTQKSNVDRILPLMPGAHPCEWCQPHKSEHCQT